MIRFVPPTSRGRRVLERRGSRLAQVLAPAVPAPERLGDQAASVLEDVTAGLRRDLQAAGFKNIHLDAPADVLDACSADGRRILLFRPRDRPGLVACEPDDPGAA